MKKEEYIKLIFEASMQIRGYCRMNYSNLPFGMVVDLPQFEEKVWSKFVIDTTGSVQIHYGINKEGTKGVIIGTRLCKGFGGIWRDSKTPVATSAEILHEVGASAADAADVERAVWAVENVVVNWQSIKQELQENVYRMQKVIKFQV